MGRFTSHTTPSLEEFEKTLQKSLQDTPDTLPYRVARNRLNSTLTQVREELSQRRYEIRYKKSQEDIVIVSLKSRTPKVPYVPLDSLLDQLEEEYPDESV